MRETHRFLRVASRDGSDTTPWITPESWDVNSTSKAEPNGADVERSGHH